MRSGHNPHNDLATTAGFGGLVQPESCVGCCDTELSAFGLFDETNVRNDDLLHSVIDPVVKNEVVAHELEKHPSRSHPWSEDPARETVQPPIRELDPKFFSAVAWAARRKTRLPPKQKLSRKPDRLATAMELFQLLNRRELASLNIRNPLRSRLLPSGSAPPQLMEVDLNLALLFGREPGQTLLNLEDTHKGQDDDQLRRVKLLKITLRHQTETFLPNVLARLEEREELG